MFKTAFAAVKIPPGPINVQVLVGETGKLPDLQPNHFLQLCEIFFEYGFVLIFMRNIAGYCVYWQTNFKFLL